VFKVEEDACCEHCGELRKFEIIFEDDGVDWCLACAQTQGFNLPAIDLIALEDEWSRLYEDYLAREHGKTVNSRVSKRISSSSSLPNED
jgi:hypothetical protein